MGTDITKNEWLEILSHMDAPSLLAMSSTSSAFFHLIEQNPSLWASLPPPFDTSRSPIPPVILVEFARAMHSFSSPTLHKLKYVASHLFVQKNGKQGRDKLEVLLPPPSPFFPLFVPSNFFQVLFSRTYNRLFTSGNVGSLLLALPFLLSLFTPLSLPSRCLFSVFFTLVGCNLMVNSVWKHVWKVQNFYDAMHMKVSIFLMLFFFLFFLVFLSFPRFH